jgi:flagellar biosynthesis/type III secretory pathway protein FliH
VSSSRNESTTSSTTSERPPGREDEGQSDDHCTLVVLRYILRVAGELPYEPLRQRITEVAPTLEETMASAEQKLIQKGIEQGRQQGIEQGTQRTLLRQLRARFGPLDEAVEARIAKADADALDRWTERVLVAQRIEDLFDDT